jgi:hypothetical protein
MNKEKSFNKKLNAIGWALLLIWWGLRWSVLLSLPEGSGLLGTSLIFLGANVIKKSAGFPTNPNNTFFGLFSLLSGGALFTFDILHLPYQLPVFETMLIVLGVLLLGNAIFGGHKTSVSES